MLYTLAHFLRDKLSCLWNGIEYLNSWLFFIRYGKKLNDFSFSILIDGYDITPMKDVSADKIVAFFSRQPKEAYTYFHPHKFDLKTIIRLKKNKSFLGYIVVDKTNNQIAGYCFNRCFFNGQGFRGRMVGIDYRGRGLGTAMNKLLNEVALCIGLRLFETVSKDNVASYRSALSASNINVVKEMPNNELYLEILLE